MLRKYCSYTNASTIYIDIMYKYINVIYICINLADPDSSLNLYLQIFFPPFLFYISQLQQCWGRNKPSLNGLTVASIHLQTHKTSGDAGSAGLDWVLLGSSRWITGFVSSPYACVSACSLKGLHLIIVDHQSARANLNLTNTLKAPFHVTFMKVLLAKARHVTKPNVEGLRVYIFSRGEKEKYIGVNIFAEQCFYYHTFPLSQVRVNCLFVLEICSLPLPTLQNWGWLSEKQVQICAAPFSLIFYAIHLCFPHL